MVGGKNIITKYSIKEIVALGFILLVYFLTLLIIPKHVFWSPDEGIRFMMVQIFSSSIDNGGKLAYAGFEKDPIFRFHPSYYKDSRIMYPSIKADQRLKFPWATWFALLSGRFYNIFGLTGVYLIPLVSSWLVTVIIWRISKILIPTLGVWVILLVGLGTPLFFYSQVLWDHTLATFCGICALWIFALRKKPRLLHILTIYLLLMIAIILRIEMFTFGVAIFLAWIVASRRAANEFSNYDNPPTNISYYKSRSLQSIVTSIKSRNIFISGILLLPFLSIILYTLPTRYWTEIYRVYQNLLPGTNTNILTTNIWARSIQQIPHLLINHADSEGLIISESLVRIGIIAVVMSLLAAAVRSWHLEIILLLPALVYMFGISLFAIITIQHYRSLHGFLITIPYALIVTYTLPKAWVSREYPSLLISLTAFVYIILGSIAVLVFRASKDVGIWPGLEWGQRYLLTLYPILAVLSVRAIKDYWYSRRPPLLRIIVVVMSVLMMLISLQVQLRGIWMLNRSKQVIASWINYLPKNKNEPVVTDIWWLPANLATYFSTQEMYSVRDNDDLSQWFILAKINDINHFTYISTYPIELEKYTDSDIQIYRGNHQFIGGLHIIKYSLKQDPSS